MGEKNQYLDKKAWSKTTPFFVPVFFIDYPYPVSIKYSHEQVILKNQASL